MSSSPDPWRYVIVVACACTQLFCPSLNFAHGVLLVALTRPGLYDVNTVTWLLSFTNLMPALGGPLAGVIINLTNCRIAIIAAGLAAFLGPALASCTSDIRIIFITFGILTGIGRGIALSTTVVVIGYWFKEDSSLASGFMFLGVGVGMLVHPRLIQYLVDQYDTDGALLLMGALSMHTCICGFLIRPSAFEKESILAKKENEGNVDIEPLSTRLKIFSHRFKKAILTNFSFLFFVLGVFLFMISLQTIITFMPDYFNFHGTTPQESAMVASITGSGSLISRALAGIITNDPNIGTMLLFEGNCGISAIFTLLIPFMATSSAGRYFYAFGIGTYLTCLYVIFGPTTLQKVGLENLAYGYGLIMVTYGIASLVGPPLAVQVKTLTDSYSAVFTFAGCSLFGACFCGFLSEMVKKTDIEQENNPTWKALLPKTVVIEESDEQPNENVRSVS